MPLYRLDLMYANEKDQKKYLKKYDKIKDEMNAEGMEYVDLGFVDGNYGIKLTFEKEKDYNDTKSALELMLSVWAKAKMTPAMSPIYHGVVG